MAEKKQTGGTGKRAKSEKPAVLSGTVPEWSSTTVISQLLGKTVRRVQQLTQEGVLETEIPPGGGARKYRTCATVQRYVAYVEAKAQETGENSRAAELTLKKLEAEVELKESQGQLHRLKTAIAEGRYLAADHATEELTEFMASFKKFAMNIPPRMAGTMSGYPDHFTGGIRMNENDLFNFQLEYTFTADWLAELDRQLALLLSTREGTMPLDRAFGLNMDFVDMPPEAAKSLYTAEVTEKVSKFIPEVRVQEVTWTGGNTGKLFPKVVITSA